MALTNSISARQKWAESHFLRTKILSYVFDKLGLTRKEDITQDLKPNRIRKNIRDVQNIITTIEENMNPFQGDIDPNHLFNIGSGKSASNETAEFLLHVVEKGEQQRLKFIEECIERPERFEESITRNKLMTFSNEGKRYKITGADKKLTSAEMVRDLFGSILYLSLQRKIDMEEVLSYPLTPIPLSLCHVDGNKQTTPKSTLLSVLEKRICSQPPPHIDVTIIDAMFFMHLQKDLPSSFGSVSRVLLSKVCSCKGNEIHLIFDKVIKPSIKDCERDARSTSNDRSSSYQITGCWQQRPK